MKVLVTGANGLVGVEAMSLLAASSIAAIGVGRGPSRLPATYNHQYLEADLASPGAVANAIRQAAPAAVLHAAAATDVDGCERDPSLAYRLNVEATAEVARACKEVGARLVAFSTDYVFDGVAGPYGEEDLPHPLSVYGRTKQLGEEATLLLASDAAVARVAVIFSPRRGQKRTFAAQVVELLSRGERVRAFEDQIASPTLAENAAAMGLNLLLETKFRGVLHTAGATSIDRAGFARAVARRFGLDESLVVPIKTDEVKLLAVRPRHSALHVEKAKQVLSSPPLHLKEALDRFFECWSLETR